MPSSRKGPHQAALTEIGGFYRVDSISNPQASRRGSGMYLEFLFLRAHSRRRVERMYWSGWSLNSFTTCSNSVIVGTTGPIGSGLPQLGLPRRFAIFALFPLSRFNYVDDVIGPNDVYSTRYLIGFAPLPNDSRGAFVPWGTRGQGPNKRPRDCLLYLAFRLRSKENENSCGWFGKSTRAAMIFAYPSWNETVGEEKCNQKPGKSYDPGRRPRRAESLHGESGGSDAALRTH